MADVDVKKTETTTHEQSSSKDVSPKTHDHKLDANSKENLDEKLDNAVDESFPASDPVSVKITK